MTDPRWVAVGRARILPVLDARVDYPWPLAELFPGVPDDAWDPFRERYPDAFGAPTVWRSSYRCFLIRSQDRTILLDSGMGTAGSPLAGVFATEGQLLPRLQRAGVDPGDVEVVILSHLHPDHVGGNFDSSGQLTFPNARHLVPAADWEAFHTPEVQAHFPFPYVEHAITPLESLGVLELVTGEHAVTDEVRCCPRPGTRPATRPCASRPAATRRCWSWTRSCTPHRSPSRTGARCSTWTRSATGPRAATCSTGSKARRCSSPPATSRSRRSGASPVSTAGATGSRRIRSLGP